MRTLLKKTLAVIGVLWFIALFVLGFLAYSVTAKGPCDGLGRPLTEAPTLMRIFFAEDRMWAGWRWFVGDMVIFWVSVAIMVSIFNRLDSK